MSLSRAGPSVSAISVHDVPMDTSPEERAQRKKDKRKAGEVAGGEAPAKASKKQRKAVTVVEEMEKPEVVSVVLTSDLM